jgi:hypothetical protein
LFANRITNHKISTSFAPSMLKFPLEPNSIVH